MYSATFISIISVDKTIEKRGHSQTSHQSFNPGTYALNRKPQDYFKMLIFSQDDEQHRPPERVHTLLFRRGSPHTPLCHHALPLVHLRRHQTTSLVELRTLRLWPAGSMSKAKGGHAVCPHPYHCLEDSWTLQEWKTPDYFKSGHAAFLHPHHCLEDFCTASGVPQVRKMIGFSIIVCLLYMWLWGRL